MDRRGRRGPDKKSAEGKFENRLWRHAVPMPLRNVCSACSTPFISNFDPNVTVAELAQQMGWFPLRGHFSSDTYPVCRAPRDFDLEDRCSRTLNLRRRLLQVNWSTAGWPTCW